MLLSRSVFPVAALGVILCALPSGSLMGQASVDETEQHRAAESYLTELRFPADGSRATAAGISVRLLWDATNDELAPGLVRRAEVGMYGMYVPRQNLSGANVLGAYRFGVVGDLRLFDSPLAGMIDPVISIGTGLWHSSGTGPGIRRTQLLRPSVTALELAPGVGVRVPFGSGIGLLFDVHDVITSRSGARNNLALGTGLRFRF
jgi:hypothetical protein